MKKIFIISIGIGIILGIALPVALPWLLSLTVTEPAFALSSYDSADKVAFGTITTIGTSVSYDTPSGTTYKPGDNFGKDIYKKIYSTVRSKGSDLAVSRTLARHPLSKEELNILIPGSSIYDFLQADPNQKITPDVPTQRRAQLTKELAEEKELADMEVQSELDVQPLEIFSNGDVSDSGFDLIADLDLMETILFGKPDTAIGDAGPGAPPGANEIGGGTGQNGGSPNGQNNPQNNGQGNAGGGGQDQAGGETKLPQGGGNGAGANGGTGSPDKGDATTVICPVNPAFNNAVLDAKKQEAAKGDANGAGKNAAGAGVGAGADANGNGGAIDDTKDGANGNADGGAGTKNNQNGNPNGSGDDWSKPSLCNDIFCLKFEAVYKKASSYQSKDNCIACHFEKINEAFKKTIDKNLSPSKMTGNIGEGPKCKRSMLNLKWNLVLIPQPILTPPNDDLVIKGDFIKNIKKFFEKYYENPGRCDNGDKTGAGGACKPDTANAEIAQNELENAPSGTDQTEVVNRIRQRLADAQEKSRQLIEQTRLESDAVSSASEFQVILQEMDTMNTFFQGYVSLFNAIAPQSKDAPCQLLIDKEKCK